ncbi:MAG: alpha/beta hydrolase [Myxococcales bacterium]|nr:alpha/beta hydrolase [Myxococcales bacterium]
MINPTTHATGDRGWSVRRIGPTTGPASPTIVWLHGLGELATTFAPITAAAALAHCAHLLIDLPGHGGARALEDAGAAAWASPPSIDATAALLATWLAPAAPVVVIGHSLGGVIATALAARAPEVVAQVIDVDGNVALPDCTYSSQIAGYALADYVAHGHAEVSARLAAHADPIIAGYGQRLATAAPAQLWRYSVDLVAWSRDEDSARRRAALTVPLTYVAGHPGGASPRSRALLAEAAVPTIEVSPAGHWPFLDQPATFAVRVAGLVAGD